MRDLLCPVSDETFDARAARIGAALTAALLAVYVGAGWWPVLAFVVTDYVVRVVASRRAPLSVAALAIRRASGAEPEPKNKGPKLFAWRVGLVLAVASLALLPFSTPASVAVATVLAAFSLLDGALGICVGCLLYTYAVDPLLRPASR